MVKSVQQSHNISLNLINWSVFILFKQILTGMSSSFFLDKIWMKRFIFGIALETDMSRWLLYFDLKKKKKKIREIVRTRDSRASSRVCSRIRSTYQSRAFSLKFPLFRRESRANLSGESRSRRLHEENPSLNDSAGRLPPETLRWAETTSATARVVSLERRRAYSQRTPPMSRYIIPPPFSLSFGITCVFPMYVYTVFLYVRCFGVTLIKNKILSYFSYSTIYG